MMASSSRSKCINDPDSFCYVCGCYALLHQRRKISEFVRSAYKAYFDIPLGDQDKKWAPHTVCHNCEESLRDWTKGKRKRLPFGVPMVWREPKDHITDCYFCIVNIKGIGKKNRHRIFYPSITSAIRPIPHSEEIPVPLFSGFAPSEDVSSTSKSEQMLQEFTSDSEESSYAGKQSSALQAFSQAELNDLVRDLALSKKAAELLASRLNEKNLLDSSARVSYFRTREKNFVDFFSENKQFVY